LDSNIASEIRRVIYLQQKALQDEDITSAKIREDRIKRAIDLITLNKEKILEALQDDFGFRNPGEILLAEIFGTINTLKYSKKHTKSWMRNCQRQSLQPFKFLGARTYVKYQPLGSVGVIVPWNFPINLCFGPLGSIFAAGNRAIIKPSEIAPSSAGLIQELIKIYYDEEELTVFTGDSNVAKILSLQPFDHLLFTGSSKNAVKVMKSASENLVPVTLELGGKSPAIISESANLRKAARRILTGKIFNGGQVCLAPDYVLIKKSTEQNFIDELKKAASTLLLQNKSILGITSLINDSHLKRIEFILEDAKQKGGKIIELLDSSRVKKLKATQMIPSVIANSSQDMIALNEEIFGPILPFVYYDNLDDAINFLNSKQSPLGIYWFGSNKREANKIINCTSSGGITINDVIAHVAQDDAPFGGIGKSGMGAYHGKEGFENFSHAKTIYEQISFDLPLKFMRPPYEASFISIINFLTKPKK